ncbi:MAG TPA: chemotaxis protein CheW, partial [Longimicrobiaceae bacterium]|nr:chemotaxis protein CheW [Longimicrobiaceae bacterium]
GTLVPVVDLRKRFELVQAGYDDDTRIVLVDFGGERLGLVVDAVTEVLRAPETAVSSPPAYFKGLSAEFLRGIVRLEGRLVVLLDLDKILSSQERMALLLADMAPAEPAAAAAPKPKTRARAKG